MAKAPDKDIELEQGKSVLNAGNQKQVERLLKKSADKAAKAAKRKWKNAGRNPFSRHANARQGGIERALENALKGALNFHANNSGKRPSIRMTAPDTGGRPFHFDHTAVSTQTINLKPGETAKAGSTYGKREFAREKRHTSRSGAHMTYLERDGAAETLEADLEAAAGVRAEIEALGREITPGGMQEYLEDPSKSECLKRGTEAQNAAALVFSYGTPEMGDTLEERVAFWDLAEEHSRSERGTIQHRLIMELPHEATPQDRLAIMKAFTAKFDEDKVPYHVVLHAPTSKNDDRNYHAHVVLLNRPAEKIDWPLGGHVKIGPTGPIRKTWDFAAKSFMPDEFRVTKWRYPERKTIHEDYRATFVKDQRKRFSDIVNERMVAVGNPVRYDHRSYKAMGFEVDAMRSISRIIKDKARDGDRIVLDYARTKRDIESEIQRIARERAPEYAQVSRVRAAVRAGDRELRALEREGALLKGKPILRRGAHAVKAFVKRKALDYARTRALHVERSIEAAQEIRSVERVVEATDPQVVEALRAKLAANVVTARAKGNKAEIARLKAEMGVVPKTALASLINDIAKQELVQLRARHERHGLVRLAKVRQALRDWREAASGARPDLTPTARPTAPRMSGIAIDPAPNAQVGRRPAKPPEALPVTYEDVVNQVFKTGFQRFMWNVVRGYGQFIAENADPKVPGRTPIDLANKLIEAVKQHPAKVDELIFSYHNGEQVPQPGVIPKWKPTASSNRVEAGSGASQQQPAFKRQARMPTPSDDDVIPFPREVTAIQRSAPTANKVASPPQQAASLIEQSVADAAQTAEQADQIPEPKRKKRDQRKKAILAQRVSSRNNGWER